MFRKSLLKIRNIFESSKILISGLNLVARTSIFRKKTYDLFLKKTSNIKKNRTYIFAIEVSSFCNAACVFCPNSFMKRKKSIMTMEIFNKIVERIKEENIRPQFFNLTGTGEPLVDRELFKKIAILKNNFPEVTVFFPSNFALADESIIKKIVSSPLDNISISLNASNPRDYRKIMKLDYKRTIDNLKKLIKYRNKVKSKLKISLTVALSPSNKNSVKDILKKWGKKVDEINFNWVHNWAGSVKNGTEEVPSPKYPCRLLFEQIVVQSNGDIPLCCVDYEGKVVGGNIMKDKILDAFYSENLNNIRKLHKDNKINQFSMCSKCRFSDRGLYWWL